MKLVSGLRRRTGVMTVVVALAAWPCLGQTTADSNDAGKASRKCETLKQRIAKEESSLALFDQTLAEDRKGRESCSTKPMCARYDDAIKRMETRKSEHEQRLAKFKADAVQACTAS